VINADFITGLGEVGGLAVFGSEEKAVLFVTDRNEDGGGTVGEYDANTGFTINRHFITGLSGPTGLTVTGNTLFVANTSSGTVANKMQPPEVRLTLASSQGWRNPMGSR
jgi:hypothetical protein